MNTVGADSRPEYYRQSAAAVIELLGSHKMGLTNAAAERRLQKDGANSLPALQHPTLVVEWLRAAIHPITLGLVVATLLAYAAGSGGATLALPVVALLDVTVRFVITRKRTDAHLPELPEHSMVLRNGQTRRIHSARLVIGDIVMLDANAAVPADMRLLSVDNLKVDESMLFGAGASGDKLTRSIRNAVPLSERDNLIWAGTRVTSGSGAAIVTAIGAQTELGRIIILANAVRENLKQPNWHWSKAWIIAGFVYVLMAAVGVVARVDTQHVLSGLIVLGLSLVPAGLYLSYMGILLRMKPRANTKLALLSQLGAVDTLLNAERSVARFKAFGLRVLHIGRGSSAIQLHALDDMQLSKQIQAGSAAFGELRPEEKLRLVRAAQNANHRVAVMSRSISDLPAQLQADASTDSSDAAALLAAARSVAITTKKARQLFFAWTLALGLLAVTGVTGLWFWHIPLAVSPVLILAFSLVIAPLLTVGLPIHGRKTTAPELVVRACALAASAYAAFLLSFGIRGIDPTYIDPTHPFVLQATATTFLTIILCTLLDRIVVSVRYFVLSLVVVAIAALIIYSPSLQTLARTASLDTTSWLLALGATALYGLLLALQNRTSRHSRAAIISLHHKAYGKTSGVKI